MFAHLFGHLSVFGVFVAINLPVLIHAKDLLSEQPLSVYYLSVLPEKSSPLKAVFGVNPQVPLENCPP